MSKKIIAFIIIIVFIIIIGGITLGLNIFKKRTELIDGGTTKERRLRGYKEKITSKEILSFEYTCGKFKVTCVLEDDNLHITSKGGESYYRDGTYFKLDYISKTNTILKELQEIIDKYNISLNNGYEHEVAGLDPSISTTIKVLYKSKEKIYKYDNQTKVIPQEAEDEIYNIFHKNAIENGYDFTSDKSNVELYNDATKEYVQGTWKGKHFGSEYKVEFNGTKIKIYKDGKLTDEGWYKIIEGDIVNDKPKKGVTIPKDRSDYEEFSDISIMKKKNDFTITMYFMKDGYSTDDLLKEE